MAEALAERLQRQMQQRLSAAQPERLACERQIATQGIGKGRGIELVGRCEDLLAAVIGLIKLG